MRTVAVSRSGLESLESVVAWLNDLATDRIPCPDGKHRSVIAILQYSLHETAAGFDVLALVRVKRRRRGMDDLVEFQRKTLAITDIALAHATNPALGKSALPG